MKKIISLFLTTLMLLSIISVSFVATEAATDRLPFSSTAQMSQLIKGFADESKTYYKLSDGTKTTVSKLAYNGNAPYITQGATSINGDFYITATFKSDYAYDVGYIFKYDRSDSKCYVSELLPIAHANDLSYNPDINMIVVANNAPDRRLVTLVNVDDLTLADQISLKDDDGDDLNIYAIDYNPVTKRYIACSSFEDTQDIGVWYNYILDENFNAIDKHPRYDLNLDSTKKPYYLKQGMCSTPDYLMHVYAGAPIGDYVNKIVVTDWDGNYIQTVSDTIKYELEDVFFDNDGYCYFIYHQNSAGGYIYSAKMTAWTAKYLPNGGEGTMADSEHYYGTSKALSTNAFTREGYTFAGWKLSRKSDGKHLYTNNNNETNEWYIPGTQPAGWRKSVYENGRKVSALAHDLFDEVYLEAQWKPKATEKQMFYIEFDPNGGTGSIPTMACVWGESNTLPENTITREDYKFLGWSARRRSTDYWGYVSVSSGADSWRTWTTSSSYTLKLYQPGTNVSKTSSEDRDIVEFMCQWEYIPNSVFVFNANGGKGEMENQKLVHGTPAPLTNNTFTKLGYTFTGWIAQKESDGTYYLANGTWSNSGTPYVFTNGETVTNLGEGTGDKINMIAQWEKTPVYTVKFDANGGTGEMEDMELTIGETATLSANTFTKTGYTFAGWTVDEKTYVDGAEITDLTSGGETVVLTAQWTPISYTVKFNANGGTGEMEDMTVAYDETVNLTANIFKKDTCVFTGWMAEDGTIYTDMAEIKNLTATAGETVTLTAQWKMYGDIDGNGKINVKDASNIQLYLANLEELTDEQLELANVSGDSKVSVRDVSTILLYIAKYITTFPVCE